MPTFSAPDGTALAYHLDGEGPPLICLPGGPTDSAYLGDLGGLTAHRRLVRLDLRGTGASASPADPGSLRCDRLVDDVEALREHLGLPRVDLLAHCAGANLALLYALRHPERIRRLVLVTPSVRAVGLTVPGELRVETVRPRAEEPWFPGAFEALRSLVSGEPAEGAWEAVAPFSYGRWDAAARAHHAATEERTDPAVVAAYGAEGAFDPDAVRSGLSGLDLPVLLLAGAVDPGAPPRTTAELAALLPRARTVVQSGASHHPWLDGPERFRTAVAEFLTAA
ncbi:alpha/beta hydrolase [Streptomyces sp. NPDC097619]|uniref:alpha/beta fold hydrolase n=1 Tax=Streptomyces sp. NPDC097619 TaxID=3157228 RepID=UPI00331CD073